MVGEELQGYGGQQRDQHLLGVGDLDIMVGKLLDQKSNTYGFDAQTEQYVDLIETGIVDPTKVVRIALQNAASVAALLITTEAMVAERPKKEAGGMPGGMGGGGMGGMDF